MSDIEFEKARLERMKRLSFANTTDMSILNRRCIYCGSEYIHIYSTHGDVCGKKKCLKRFRKEHYEYIYWS